MAISFTTSQYTASLPVQAVFSAVFLLAFLSYKITWIISTILISNLLVNTKEKDGLRRMAKWGLIGKFAGFIVLIVSTAIKIFTACVQTVLIVFYSFVPFIVLGFVFMMIQDRWGDTAVMVTSYLNNPDSPVSQSINYLIRIPFKVLDDVSFYVIPGYNFIVYVFIHIPLEFFSNFLFGEGSSLVVKGIKFFAQSISLLTQAVAQYARVNHVECPIPEPLCWNFTADALVKSCAPVDKSTIAAVCLDSVQRQFDAMPFLTAMMNGFSCILKALAMGCNSLESVINFFCFPLTDPSLWKALHSIINTILYPVVGAPTSASARCSLGGGFSVRPSLCTPDFAPAFDFAVEAANSIGIVIDNFFDMVYLLIMYGNNAECPRGQLTQHSLFLPLWKDPFILSLFGSNSTVLVTLTNTLFALTDGQHSVYVSHKKDVERSYFPNAWGSLGVNPLFGIARVYDKSGNVAMLGCRCIDAPNEMIVQCSTSTQASISSTNTVSFNSTWEVVDAGRFMQCASVRILVQSIRWPERRVMLSENVPPTVSVPYNGKIVADAVIYVIPTCGGGDDNTLACLDSRIFTLSNCYPFCLALHTKNVGAHPLLFRGSDSWMNGVLVADRDCVPIGSILASSTKDSASKSSSCSSDISSLDTTISNAATSGVNSENGAGVECNYNPICTSWIANKSDYYPPSSSYPSLGVPAFADTSKFVKNVLDGQPVVAAGGMFMRVSKIAEERFVDFPVLTGNQHNEFFMEVASPAGIPVATAAVNMGESIESEKKGFVSLPPRYIEMIDVYNPATLSMNALWYAVNPSYDWISCFAKWCATEGRDTCMQLMVTSSYTPIRLWKVLYKSSACFIRADDGVHVCREDVAQGFSLDTSMDLPKLGSTEIGQKLGSMCSTEPLSEFNLWVESIEYFDELNIAVTVRRGSIRALHNLMQHVIKNNIKTNVSTLGSSAWYRKVEGGDLGKTVIYFVHSQNISLVRPLEPWTSIDGIDPGFLSVIHGSSFLCPELRFLPSFGSLFSKSFAALLHGIKTPVNLLSNFFALTEMLTARSLSACPADGFGHSAIQDCGMGLFDLSPFFTALFDANQAFWSILAWLASLIQQQEGENNDNTVLKYFESFVTGVSVYGEAGKIVSLFKVTDIAENLMDTGIQDTVLGRRLLNDAKRCKSTNNNTNPQCQSNSSQNRRLLGMKEMSKIAGRSALSGILSVFSSGVSTVFSISQSLTGAMAGKMSSADFGILLSSTNPTFILGSAVTAPGIVWAQFTYETVLPIFLDLVSTFVYAKKNPKSTAIIWVHLHAAKDNYEKLIEPRMTQGCVGLRLMLGYSGGLPTAVYHNCISASKMHHAFFSLATLVFSEVPFYSCMCVQSSGQPFPDFIIENCMEWVPVARKGLWQSIILKSGQDVQQLCKWYGDYIHDTAMHTFDEWTSESHLAATSLASFLQDLIVPDAKEMGMCINQQSNPNIFVMLPIPSEHYHICGKTTDCRLRCADAFAMFDYELKRYESMGFSPHKAPQTYDVTAESPFFNMYQSSNNNDLYYIQDRILAISARNFSSSYACSTCSYGEGGGCLIVAKTQWETISSISVTTYCTPPPSALKATIYASGGGNWDFSTPLIDDGQQFALTYCNFALQPDEMYVLMAYTSTVVSISSSGIFSFDSASAADNLRKQQKIFVARYDSQDTFHLDQRSVLFLILDTDALSSAVLSSAIQEYVFEKATVYNAYVKECKIVDLVEIASGVKGKLVFFMTIMFTAQGWVKREEMPEEMGFVNNDGGGINNNNAQNQNMNMQLMKTGYITAVLTWFDPTIHKLTNNNNNKHLDYFLPCACEVEGQIICQKPSYTPGCFPNVDAVLFLAQRGTFLHVIDFTYLFIPKADALDAHGKALLLQYVNIYPNGLNTTYPVQPPLQDLKYPKYDLKQPMKLYKSQSVTKEQITRQELGYWSCSDVFSLSGLATRVVRSPVFLTKDSPIRWLQAVQTTSATVQWLREVRIMKTNNGFELVSVSSQKTQANAIVKTKCSPYDCASCVSASVRLVCHALQDCMLSRCIGTTINYKNILCSIGVVVQQLYMQMVTSWRAVYLFMVEISVFALNGFGGSLSKKIVLSFPTDLFYSLVCACKDVFASFIGMAMSAVESVHGLFTTQRIDLSINTYVTPEDAEFTIQTRTIGGLVFNIVSDATLYPILALHRWLLCITNSDTLTDSMDISVQFGDLTMDQTWGVCSPLSDKLSMLMDSTNLGTIVQDDVDGFISFSMSLLSGIGETVLYGAILTYDSVIAFLESIVWNIQNMMEAFNLRNCKVTNYMQRVVLQCACGDTPYYINGSQRHGTWADGALWCSGSLAVTLTDGTQGIIYNPYSLQELSNGLSGITEYIQCLASSPSSTICQKSYNANTLTVLTDQRVEPIAVWAKCKSNYIHQTWDIAAGALFSENIVAATISTYVSEAVLQNQARQWAFKIAPEFLQCMQAPSRFYQDYSSCLIMYLNLTTGRLPNAYFLLTDKTELTSKEPPDACMVFSGLNASAQSGSTLQQTMQHCIMDQVDRSADPTKCPFNPSVWSGSDPRKLPVAKLFGIIGSGEEANFKASQFYDSAIAKLKAAYETFNKTFAKSATKMQVALFSADGDLIHDFIDCVFLGPYTRVDMLPCDMEGSLECPFYARDENKGLHRNFTACFGALMRGDGTLPFTCGSQTRRALIKYFFRIFSSSKSEGGGGGDWSATLTKLITNRVLGLVQNLTNPSSFGCLNESSGRCEGSACTRENNYKPCLDMEFAISALNVSKLILSEMLLKVDSYYANVMHDTAPWAMFYNVSKAPGEQSLPAQWGSDTASATRATEDGIFKPMDPVIRYDQTEVYSMPSHDKSEQTRFEGSAWSLCMSLISQGQMSLPLSKSDADGDWRPLGTENAFLQSLDWYNLDSVAEAVRKITQKAAEKSPFMWHRGRFHAPSKSAMCKTQNNIPNEAGARLRFSDVEFDDYYSTKTFKVPFQEDLSLPFHGFTWGMLGRSHELCLCGSDHPLLSGECVFSSDFCISLPNTTTTISCIQNLQSICGAARREYSKSLIPDIWQCLHTHLPGVRCPELGPSDSWGLFPVDCSGQLCTSAGRWAGNAQQDVVFEGIRLVTEGRAGLKLPNIQYVNSTYHKVIDYSQQFRPASDYQIRKCFNVEELADNEYDLMEDWIKGLFPAAQLHHDSPVVAYCSRYVIEVARAEALSFVSMEASTNALQLAKVWRRKCHVKVKHLTSCARLGVYYDIPPPPKWKQFYTKHCDVRLDNVWSNDHIYLTPWCVLIDQEKREMFDARICLRNAMSDSERQSLANGNTPSKLLSITHVDPLCRLAVQPLDLLLNFEYSAPFTSLFTMEAKRISTTMAVELSLAVDELYVQTHSSVKKDNDPISHVLDWWQDGESTPVGFHVTASMLKDEIAPMTFDTHYAFDNASYALHYVHSALRDQSLLLHTTGSGGLCRAHSVGMPIFETNTNRVCTRMPEKGKYDSPHLPVDVPKTESNIHPMGPYSSQILNENFGEEKCAWSYEDVPWPKKDNDDFDFAGSFPGISRYLKMDENGRAKYTSTSNTFPPLDTAEMLPVKGMYRDWGECNSVIVWDDSPPCSESRSSSDCPRNTLCLKKGNASDNGICFSTAAFRVQNTRPPCFRTEHCVDGLVCLSDGGCSPLYLHMWNAKENGIKRMEFALMANDCGFQNPVHPFTQTLRGVSPWEQVPDLLHMHGMCSHRNWFAYRNAINDEVCSLENRGDSLECDTTKAEWPEIQMRFDGCRISALPSSQRYTMEQQYALQIVPHPCDTEYMHAAIKNQRLKVCSGYQGIEKGTTVGNYIKYVLNDEGTWKGTVPQLLSSSNNSVHWMRTHAENSDLLNMGNFFTDKQNTRLGFLGAEINSSEPILSDMTEEDGVRFFRCTDKTACQMPEYTFGGVSMEHRLNLAAGVSSANYSETSLRRCGAIGSLFSEKEPDVCRLDIELFPLFAYLLKTDTTTFIYPTEEGNTNVKNLPKGCFAIWPESVYMGLDNKNQKRVQLIDFETLSVNPSLTLSLVQNNPSTLFCSSNENNLLCIYLARFSNVLSESSRTDHVSTIADFLNSIFRQTTSLLSQAVSNHGVQRAYESVNLCSEEVWKYTQQIQASIQYKYYSSITSGFYMAFQLSLYEFPQQWFHQCMLTILLSIHDSSIPMPNTFFMTETVNIQLPLWSSLGQINFCSENTVREKSGLYLMLCKGKHPAYTFKKSENELVNTILRIVEEKIMDVADSNLYENQQKSTVKCFTKALWNCEDANDINNQPCATALAKLYNSDGSCSLEEAFDLCSTKSRSVGVVSLRDSQEISLSDISEASHTERNLGNFLSASTTSIKSRASQQTKAKNYITSQRNDMINENNNDDFVPLASVQGIDTSIFSGFMNTTEWMDTTCRSTGIEVGCGGITTDMPCLFKETHQYEDADRYFTNNTEPFLLIYLAGNSDPFKIDLCAYIGGRTSSSSLMIYQFNLDSDLQEDNSGPAIVSVEVPPGVLVKAHSSKAQITSDEWETSKINNILPSNKNFVNCAWKSNPIDKNAWWPYAEGAQFNSEYNQGFDSYVINFQDMENWHNNNNDIWKSNGCGQMDSVYALEIIFEKKLLSETNSHAFCSISTPYPLTQTGFLNRRPQCDADQRAFRVANSARYSFWRCAPCTRFQPEIARQGFFDCTLGNGLPLDNLFTEDMLKSTFNFIYSPTALQQFFGDKMGSIFPGFKAEESLVVIMQGGELNIMTPIKENTKMNHLENWGLAEGCTLDQPLWECKGFNNGLGFDASKTLNNERIIWNKAVNNPQLPFTMDCEGQKYTKAMQEKCNPKVNKKLRALSDFVEKQYRQKNGVWLQTVDQGQGVAWKANVAHSAVDKFTLFYTSGDRPEEQVISKQVLGEGPCFKTTKDSHLDERICIESKKRNSPFEPLHPWMGGDFNPFMGATGLDECPYISSSSCTAGGRASGSSKSLISMCPCACSPSWACGGINFNYSKEFMALEFPEDSACLMQKYRDASVMNADDPSNICSVVQQTVPVSRGCLFPHGLLGGVANVGSGTVTATNLHSAQGVATQSMDSMAHQMMDSYSADLRWDTTASPLWSGQRASSNSKEIPFLKMDRAFLHPAHIAFGLDSSISSTLPLVIKAIALLPGNNFSEIATSASWVENLKTEWISELYTGIEDNPNIKSIISLYPQLLPDEQKSGQGDWSCPIRKYAFLAGDDENFGPLTPNPISAHAIFGMGGVHPLIKTQGPYPNLAPYFTTNGACFYRSDPLSWPQIEIEDVENPCGLRGILYLLASQTESLMSVQESFGSRCNDIIDTPDVGGKLRSGETLNPIPDLKSDCGILHRISPAMISTKGSKGSIKKKASLTTMSPGGDCHMGRAFQITKELLQGKKCYLTRAAGEYTVDCDGQRFSLTKVRPISLEDLLRKTNVKYRGDLKYRTLNSNLFPTFLGPSGNTAPEGMEEISFGMLYSASLKETLANDLIYHCSKTKGCAMQNSGPLWSGDMQYYTNGTLLKESTTTKEERAILNKDPILNSERITSTLKAQIDASTVEMELWNQTDWTWTFLDHSQPPQGNVNKSMWTRNRTQACQASLNVLISKTPSEKLEDSVKRVTLCAPPPTGEMGELCNAMTEHQTEIVQKNCQIWGKGDCISNMAMFYLPYMWSSTNQDYAFDRVRDYYEEILLAQGEGGTFNALCVENINSTVLTTLAALSIQQNSICPASSMEVFKDMLSTLKKAGHDLLYLAYNQVMMIANIIASVFTIIEGKDGGYYMESAIRYMMELFRLVAKLLVPLLDIFLELLSQISPVGKIMKKLLIVLCKVYNWIMKEIIINVWCGILRPVVIAVLKAVQYLAFMSSSIVDLIQKIIDFIGDGSVDTCIAYYNAAAIMQCPSDNEFTANTSNFQPQPIATLCWSNEGGGGIFTGATESLLTCTSSDTCAKDPLLFDDASKEGLVPCGSCPSIQTDPSSSVSGFRFGCDTYIQRCVCNIMDNTKTQCMKNYDCSTPQNAMCGVASNLDGVRSSYIAMPCGACGGMGMEPICMIDGQGAYGVCGCAQITTTLLSCTAEQLGKHTVALYSTKFCTTILDTALKTLITETINTQTIHLDFSQVAVVSCSLSSQQALCMDVSLPFSVSSGSTPLVVLLKLLSIIQIGDTNTQAQGGRRLLSQTDLLGHVHSSSHNDNLPQPLFNEWVPLVLQESKKYCNHDSKHRDELKRCLHSVAMAKYVVNHFKLSKSGQEEHYLMDTMQSASSDVIGSMWALRMYTDRSGLFPFLMDLNPTFKYIRQNTQFIYNVIKQKEINGSWSTIMNTTEPHSRHLLASNTNEGVSISTNRGDWAFNCTSLQKPLNKVVNAFWSTVHFYEHGRESKVKNSSSSISLGDNATNCTLDNGFSNCIGYSIPPSPTTGKKSTTLFEMISAATLYAPTLGVGGERVLEAFLSPMDYNEATQGDFITGKRILYDMASCNYTQLTLGGGNESRNFSVIFIALVLLFQILSSMCMPLSCCQWALWVFVFPALFFWAMYNTSPLCWPMVPTSFVHDLYLEVTYFLPQDLKVPKFLVKSHCTLDGKLVDGTYDSSCFSSCSEPPFLFVSWQDSLVWWICEASTEQCTKIGRYLSVFGSFFKDMISSSDYYASVINYSSNDPEFVQAHRLCAFFSFYQVIFLMISIVFTCYLLPTILLGIIEVFMGCAILLMDTYIAEG